MNTFEIYRWDSVTCSKDNTPKPMIYVKPDISLMNYFKRNKFKVWLKIKNTASAYDNQAYYGIVEKSAYRPNYTPNYFNSKGMYVVTLQTDYWLGYPREKGEVEFLNGTVSIVREVPEPDPISEEPSEFIDDEVEEEECSDLDIGDMIEDVSGDAKCKSNCLESCKATGKENCNSFCTELCTDGRQNKIIIGSLVILFILLLFYVINK